jgi:hypothetical protein
MAHFSIISYVTEETVALFQVATDEQWGADCSKMMDAVSIHDFDRHFQIARSTAFRTDILVIFANEWHVAEKTGNIQHCIEVNNEKHRAMESYMRAAPPTGQEVSCYLASLRMFVGVETCHQHLAPRQNITGVLKYAGIRDTPQAEEGYRSSAEFVLRSIAHASADGLTHMLHDDMVVAMIRALLSFSMDTRDVDLSWLEDLPPADAPLLYDITWNSVFSTTVRVLVAEVFEQQGRHADAIRFVQTDLQDCHNRNVPSKVRAGRVLGRCHAALGQHMLSVSAFDAAIDLAQSRKLLLSEALAVRGRAAAGRNGVSDSELHWDENTGKQRLAEVVDRMQGPREVLDSVLLLPQ